MHFTSLVMIAGFWFAHVPIQILIMQKFFLGDIVMPVTFDTNAGVLLMEPPVNT
jgi:hypothetical protein